MATASRLLGQSLGHYRILEQIGAGGMGVVYRAHDERLDRDVALKILPPGAVPEQKARERFRKEAQVLAKLNHANVATIHDFDTQNGIDFLVMEYVRGITLAQELAKRTLTEKEVLALGEQIANGLDHAHSQGLVHCDLKPGNIMVSAEGLAKLVDFGIAKLLQVSETAATESLTMVHSLAGTLPYLGPEQLLGRPADASGDIYAMGAVLYEMATGTRPFPHPQRTSLIFAILHQMPRSPCVLNRRVSPGLDRIIMKCLDKEPANRYPSAGELRADLQRLRMGGSVPALVPVRRHRRKALTSIAILPLVNTRADPETEHVADGITENIINTLSRLPKLRVMARSTVFRYKGRDSDPISAGRELNVGAVLTGRLVQRGNTLNVSTELVDVSDGARIWGAQYNRSLSEIFSVQEEIATEISSRLRLKLTGKDRQQLAKHYTENREAYQAYLRGRYLASKYTEGGMRKAIEHFRQAIEIDPAFALAYAGLAMAYWNVSAVQFAPNEVMPKAREAARKALEIDPQLAESHAAVALVKMAYEWQRAEAEREFQVATQLNPGYATIYQWHGWHLAIMGRLEESIAELKRAQELDPLSEINTYIGLSHYWNRQYAIAIKEFQKALELYPDFWLPHLYLGWTYLQQGQIKQAEEELTEAFRRENSPWTVASLAHAAAVSGDRAQVQELLRDLHERADRQFVAPYFVARIWTGLGEKEQAFAWLEKACGARDECLTWLKVDPTMDSLSADPHYLDLLGRLGLSSEARR
jgi:serine/threonine protein kinase/Tfp pilus assembly protein PilF